MAEVPSSPTAMSRTAEGVLDAGRSYESFTPEQLLGAEIQYRDTSGATITARIVRWPEQMLDISGFPTAKAIVRLIPSPMGKGAGEVEYPIYLNELGDGAQISLLGASWHYATCVYDARSGEGVRFLLQERTPPAVLTELRKKRAVRVAQDDETLDTRVPFVDVLSFVDADGVRYRRSTASQDSNFCRVAPPTPTATLDRLRTKTGQAWPTITVSELVGHRIGLRANATQATGHVFQDDAGHIKVRLESGPNVGRILTLWQPEWKNASDTMVEIDKLSNWANCVNSLFRRWRDIPLRRLGEQRGEFVWALGEDGNSCMLDQLRKKAAKTWRSDQMKGTEVIAEWKQCRWRGTVTLGSAYVLSLENVLVLPAGYEVPMNNLGCRLVTQIRDAAGQWHHVAQLPLTHHPKHCEWVSVGLVSDVVTRLKARPATAARTYYLKDMVGCEATVRRSDGWVGTINVQRRDTPPAHYYCIEGTKPRPFNFILWPAEDGAPPVTNNNIKYIGSFVPQGAAEPVQVHYQGLVNGEPAFSTAPLGDALDRLRRRAQQGEAQQSIPDGTRVRFELKDVPLEEFEEAATAAEAHDGAEATVLRLGTFTELGEKDFEYYNIRFDDGIELQVISGYHLEVLTEPAPQSTSVEDLDRLRRKPISKHAQARNLREWRYTEIPGHNVAVPARGGSGPWTSRSGVAEALSGNNVAIKVFKQLKPRIVTEVHEMPYRNIVQIDDTAVRGTRDPNAAPYWYEYPAGATHPNDPEAEARNPTDPAILQQRRTRQAQKFVKLQDLLGKTLQVLRGGLLTKGRLVANEGGSRYNIQYLNTDGTPEKTRWSDFEHPQVVVQDVYGVWDPDLVPLQHVGQIGGQEALIQGWEGQAEILNQLRRKAVKIWHLPDLVGEVITWHDEDPEDSSIENAGETKEFCEVVTEVGEHCAYIATDRGFLAVLPSAITHIGKYKVSYSDQGGHEWTSLEAPGTDPAVLEQLRAKKAQLAANRILPKDLVGWRLQYSKSLWGPGEEMTEITGATNDSFLTPVGDVPFKAARAVQEAGNPDGILFGIDFLPQVDENGGPAGFVAARRLGELARKMRFGTPVEELDKPCTKGGSAEGAGVATGVGGPTHQGRGRAESAVSSGTTPEVQRDYRACLSQHARRTSVLGGGGNQGANEVRSGERDFGERRVILSARGGVARLREVQEGANRGEVWKCGVDGAVHYIGRRHQLLMRSNPDLLRIGNTPTHRAFGAAWPDMVTAVSPRAGAEPLACKWGAKVRGWRLTEPAGTPPAVLDTLRKHQAARATVWLGYVDKDYHVVAKRVPLPTEFDDESPPGEHQATHEALFGSACSGLAFRYREDDGRVMWWGEDDPFPPSFDGGKDPAEVLKQCDRARRMAHDAVEAWLKKKGFPFAGHRTVPARLVWESWKLSKKYHQRGAAKADKAWRASWDARRLPFGFINPSGTAPTALNQLRRKASTGQLDPKALEEGLARGERWQCRWSTGTEDADGRADLLQQVWDIESYDRAQRALRVCNPEQRDVRGPVGAERLVAISPRGDAPPYPCVWSNWSDKWLFSEPVGTDPAALQSLRQRRALSWHSATSVTVSVGDVAIAAAEGKLWPVRDSQGAPASIATIVCADAAVQLRWQAGAVVGWRRCAELSAIALAPGEEPRACKWDKRQQHWVLAATPPAVLDQLRRKGAHADHTDAPAGTLCEPVDRVLLGVGLDGGVADTAGGAKDDEVGVHGADEATALDSGKATESGGTSGGTSMVRESALPSENVSEFPLSVLGKHGVPGRALSAHRASRNLIACATSTQAAKSESTLPAVSSTGGNEMRTAVPAMRKALGKHARQLEVRSAASQGTSSEIRDQLRRKAGMKLTFSRLRELLETGYALWVRPKDTQGQAFRLVALTPPSGDMEYPELTLEDPDAPIDRFIAPEDVGAIGELRDELHNVHWDREAQCWYGTHTGEFGSTAEQRSQLRRKGAVDLPPPPAIVQPAKPVAAPATKAPLVAPKQKGPPPLPALVVNNLADAIYVAEGGAKAKHPYGVLSVDVKGAAMARQITVNSIYNNWARWHKAGRPGSQGPYDIQAFIQFMARRWAPLGVDNDPTGLNRNWPANVWKAYMAGAAPKKPLRKGAAMITLQQQVDQLRRKALLRHAQDAAGVPLTALAALREQALAAGRFLLGFVESASVHGWWEFQRVCGNLLEFGTVKHFFVPPEEVKAFSGPNLNAAVEWNPQQRCWKTRKLIAPSRARTWLRALTATKYSKSCVMAAAPKAWYAQLLAWSKKHIPEGVLVDNGDSAKGREEEPHVTVLWGLKQPKPDARLLEILRAAKPLEIKLGKVSRFENDDYDVLKIDVEGPDELWELNKELCKLPYENDYPDYRPHLTLAYVEKGALKELDGDTTFEGKTFRVDKVEFAGAGDSEDPDRVKIDLPLGHKGLSRHAQGGSLHSKLLKDVTVKDLSALFQRPVSADDEEAHAAANPNEQSLEVGDRSPAVVFDDDTVWWWDGMGTHADVYLFATEAHPDWVDEYEERNPHADAEMRNFEPALEHRVSEGFFSPRENTYYLRRDDTEIAPR